MPFTLYRRGAFGSTLAVHVVFEDHNATILRAVYDKPISRVKPYSVAVSRKLIHQIGSPPNRQRPTGKVVTVIEKRILRYRVEEMFAVNESG